MNFFEMLLIFLQQMARAHRLQKRNHQRIDTWFPSRDTNHWIANPTRLRSTLVATIDHQTRPRTPRWMNHHLVVPDTDDTDAAQTMAPTMALSRRRRMLHHRVPKLIEGKRRTRKMVQGESPLQEDHPKVILWLISPFRISGQGLCPKAKMDPNRI